MREFVRTASHHVFKRVLSSSSWALVRRLSVANQGLALVEFAIIAPLLLGLLLGAVEIGQAITIDRRVSNISSAAADLVAQSDTVACADLEDIFQLSQTILEPYGNTGLLVTLTSVVADEENETTVDWSRGLNSAPAHSAGSAYSLPEGMTTPFSSVIVAEVIYSYTSPFSKYITGTLTMGETYHLKPRKSARVVLTGC